jgi:hypothetical protein
MRQYKLIEIPVYRITNAVLGNPRCKRGLVGEASPERGGKRKKLYNATAQGMEIARLTQESRNMLWLGI